MLLGKSAHPFGLSTKLLVLLGVTNFLGTVFGGTKFLGNFFQIPYPPPLPRPHSTYIMTAP